MKRNYGIDLLRVVSMLMIVCSHIIWHGGVREATELFSIKYEFLSFLQILVFCSVNCYALTSGYVMYNKKIKWGSIISMYLQVSFYSILFFLILGLSNKNLLSVKSVLCSFIPFLDIDYYWYYCAYFSLSFFIPYLNEYIQNVNKHNLETLIICMLLVSSILPSFFDIDFSIIRRGFSPLWLANLYIIGGYLAKYNVQMKSKKKCMKFIVFVLPLVLNWMIKLFMEFSTNTVYGYPKGRQYMHAFISPFILISSIVLFLIFSNLKLNQIELKITEFLSVSTFGVYLIHENRFVKQLFIMNRFSSFANYNFISMCFFVLCATVVIFGLCTCLEHFRLKLFQLLKVDRLVSKITILCLSIKKKIQNLVFKTYSCNN